MLFHRFAELILRGLLANSLDHEVVGLENVPRKGPLIVAINHMKFLDPALAMVFIPPDLTPSSTRAKLQTTKASRFGSREAQARLPNCGQNYCGLNPQADRFRKSCGLGKNEGLRWAQTY